MKKHNLIGSIWLITIASALFAPAAYSQFHVGIDYRYCLGIREQMIDRELYIAEYDMHNYYLQLTAIYQITPQIATGIGISAGMAEYHKLYTFPVFATVRFSPIKSHTPLYIFTDLGYTIPCKDKRSMPQGWIWNTGIGYRWMFRKHFGLNFQFSYFMQQYKGVKTTMYERYTNKSFTLERNNLRHSLAFTLGLVF